MLARDKSAVGIPQESWLAPKDAFSKLGPRVAFRRLGVLIAKEAESKNRIAKLERALGDVRDKHYGKFGKNSFDRTLPRPAKEPKINEGLNKEWQKYYGIIAEKEAIEREALEDFIRQLQQGKLTARGFKYPGSAGDELQYIKPEQWYALAFDDNWDIVTVEPGQGRIAPQRMVAYIRVTIADAAQRGVPWIPNWMKRLLTLS